VVEHLERELSGPIQKQLPIEQPPPEETCGDGFC
jgi:hypothetical protein